MFKTSICVQVCGAPLADAADVVRHRALHAELIYIKNEVGRIRDVQIISV
jgi:hypothetical protein